jgi:hypothetical protein
VEPATGLHVNVWETLATSGPGLAIVPGERFAGGGVFGDGGTQSPDNTSLKHVDGDEMVNEFEVPTI